MSELIKSLNEKLSDLLKVAKVENAERIGEIKGIVNQIETQEEETNKKYETLSNKYLDMCHNITFNEPLINDTSHEEPSEKTFEECLKEVINKKEK